MSTLTTNLLIGAAVCLALYALNAVFYRRRHGTLLRAEQRPARKKMSGSELLAFSLMGLALLAGFAAPYLAPESPFTTWLAQPWAKVAYVAWCLIGGTLLGAALAVATKRRATR